MSTSKKAKPEQLPDIIALSDRVFRGPQQVSMGEAFQPLFAPDNCDHLWIIEDEQTGMPVSLMGLLPAELSIDGCNVRIASMGSVCTDVEQRGKQYASQLLKHSLEQLYEEKVAFLFISGDRSLYMRHDAMHVSSVYQFNIASPLQLDITANDSLYITEWQEDDTAKMLDIMKKDTAYFERTAAGFNQLISCGSLLSCYPAEQHVWVCKDGNEMAAYIIFGIWQKEGKNLGEIIEYAGNDDAIVHLMREVMAGFDTAGLSVGVEISRKSLADRLISMGLTFRTTPITGTVRMIHFPALWESLMPCFEARLGKETASALKLETISNGYRISMGSESIAMDLRMATTLVFNGTPLSQDSQLKETLSRIFPIPMVNPKNLNYV